MKVKFFEAVHSTVSEVVELAERTAREDKSRKLRKAIVRLEREFQLAVHDVNLLACRQIRGEINELKQQLKAL